MTKARLRWELSWFQICRPDPLSCSGLESANGGAETWLEGKTASTSYWAVWRSTCMCKRPASRMSDFIPITQKHN